MAIYEVETKKNKWVHIDTVDQEAGDFLRDGFKFHPLDIEDVVSGGQRSKIDIYKYYLFLICVFPYFDEKEKNKIRGREVDIFLTKDTLVTISKKPFPLLTEVFNKVSQSSKLQKMWLDRGPSFLLYKLLEALFRDSNSTVDVWGKRIAGVEDDVYDHELKSVAHDLAFLRRGVLAIRRVLDPQRFTINSLVNLQRDYVPVAMADYFDNIHDYVEKMWVVAENHRDTVDGLHLTNESLISQHTNKTIKLLTIISVSLMPLTVLSGIYGMNITHLPYADKPIVIAGIFAVAILLILISTIFIYRKTKL